MSKNPIVWVHAHPRSGTNLLMAMMKQNFYEDRDVSFSGGQAGHWGNRFPVMPNEYEGLYQDAHAFYNGQRDSIYLVRDGRDVCVSMYLTYRFRHKADRNILFSEYIQAPLDWYKTPGHKANPGMTLVEHWKKHVDSWSEDREGMDKEGTWFVTYGDLFRKPEETLDGIATRFGLEYCHGGPTRVKDLVGPDSHTGQKVGRWRGIFEEEDLEYFHSIVPEDYWGLYE
jgi:hypothetical protein